MQAVSLVTSDEFLIPYNLTINTEDVLHYIRKLLLEWNDDNVTRNANFDHKYGIDFAEVIGSSGFCYNFNMADADEIFNLNL
jgi:hypothetical protein